jgi:hypothetical protein
LLVFDRTRQDAVSVEQDASVLGNARTDGPSTPRRAGYCLGGGQGLGMLLQPLDAEEFGEDRLFDLGARPNQPASGTGRVREGLARSHVLRR